MKSDTLPGFPFEKHRLGYLVLVGCQPDCWPLRCLCFPSRPVWQRLLSALLDLGYLQLILELVVTPDAAAIVAALLAVIS